MRNSSIQPWGFARRNEHAEVTVEGSLTVNDIELALTATLDGVGVYLPEPMIASQLAQGRLVVLLEDWSRTMPGVFLYHPSRRQTPMPLEVFLRFVEKWRRHALKQPCVANATIDFAFSKQNQCC